MISFDFLTDDEARQRDADRFAQLAHSLIAGVGRAVSEASGAAAQAAGDVGRAVSEASGAVADALPRRLPTLGEVGRGLAQANQWYERNINSPFSEAVTLGAELPMNRPGAVQNVAAVARDVLQGTDPLEALRRSQARRPGIEQTAERIVFDPITLATLGLGALPAVGRSAAARFGLEAANIVAGAMGGADIGQTLAPEGQKDTGAGIGALAFGSLPLVGRALRAAPALGITPKRTGRFTGAMGEAAAAAAGPEQFPIVGPERVGPEDRLGILQQIEPGLTRWDRALNWVKTRLGADGQPLGTLANEYATPATRAMDAAKFNASSQAMRLSLLTDRAAREVFTFDKYGRIQGLTGNPTIQDLAAKLPQWLDELTPEQQRALQFIREETQPFLDTLKAAGVDITQERPDIVPGGFYLPRGRADLEGELPYRLRGGSGRGGSRMAEEKSARFDTMTQGIEKGYEYVPFREAMLAFGEHVGNRASAQQVAQYFRDLMDESGIRIGQTQVERLLAQSGDLVARVSGLKQQIDSLARQLATAQRRGYTAAREAGRLETELGRQQSRAESLLDQMAARSQQVGAQQEAIGTQADTAAEQLRAQIRESRTLSPEQQARFGQQNLQLNSREQAAQDLLAAQKRVAEAKSQLDRLKGRLEGRSELRAGQQQTPLSYGRRLQVAQEKYDQALAELQQLQAAATETPKPRFGPGVLKDANTVSLADANTALRLMREKGEAAIDDLLNEQAGRLRELERQIGQLNRRKRVVSERALEHQGDANILASQLQWAKQELANLRPAWELAKERAREMPRGMSGINIAQLNGMSFPDAVATVINQHLENMKPARGRGAMVLHTVDAINTLMRGLQAAGDLSFLGIQGLLGLVRDPRSYGQALRVAFRAMNDESAVGAFLRDFDQRAAQLGRPTSRDWAAAGLHIGGRESEFFARAKGAGVISEAANAVRAAPLMKQSERMFGSFGDALRQELADTLYEAALRRGEAVSDPKKLAEIARAANLMTGVSPRRAGGSVGQIALFAPRYLQSQLELVTQAFRRGSITATEARQSLLRLLGAGSLLTIAANEALGNPIEDTVLPWQTANGKVRVNPNFMRIRVPGLGDVSLFGPWDSLLHGTLNATFGAAGALGAPTEGSATALLRTKASPAITLAWNLLSGTNPLGEDTRSLGGFVRQFLPFAYQNVGEESPLKTLTGLTGLKVSPLTPTEELDQVARERFGKKFYDLEPVERAQVKEARPDLWQRAVEKGPDLRKQVEQVKTQYYNEQLADDRSLERGEIDMATWRERHSARQRQLGAALEALYAQKPPASTANTPLDSYFQVMQQAKQPNGEVDWTQVDAWLASQPQAVQDYIDRNTGLNGTPFSRTYRKMVKEALPYLKAYQQMPAYLGLSVEEGQQVQAVVRQAQSLAQLLGVTPKYALTLLLPRSGLSPEAQYVAMNQRRFSNPERRLFWQEHAAVLEPVFGNLPLQEGIVADLSPNAALLAGALPAE